MNVAETNTVAQTVTENIKAAHVFKKYGIDFCCGGNVTIENACKKAKIDQAKLISDLENIDQVTDLNHDYKSWDADFLADYIFNIHHTYVEESIPLILQYGKKVTKVHGHHYTELSEIFRLFEEVAAELGGHLKKEELILFPFVKKLVEAKRTKTKVDTPQFQTVDYPIKMKEEEHETAGEIMRQIAILTNNYTPPEGACNTFRAYYAKLDEFEQDLHKHVHLENNILFPKALALEKEVR
ncbi:iron-sulfur cluster repair di-iron protein [Zunongwangia pacifica]|uniref:Iron-sulfur cluster repair di-iron protein n=1 Tax=Zunongwangia pacifica TaxID=2911062 RepID=A0A9X1ZT71_9FLAO|nr:iron-sulfur cluster repair di-iron protein [Zunongwangia pacifica]MCL6220587.1 iron-sulfur cluster repair di-iron protein [Zunongwangia pacifica]